MPKTDFHILEDWVMPINDIDKIINEGGWYSDISFESQARLIKYMEEHHLLKHQCQLGSRSINGVDREPIYIHNPELCRLCIIMNKLGLEEHNENLSRASI